MSSLASSGLSSTKTASTVLQEGRRSRDDQDDSRDSQDNLMACFGDDMIGTLNDHDSTFTSVSEGFVYCKDYGMNLMSK
jgi:hypothetical protein